MCAARDSFILQLFFLFSLLPPVPPLYPHDTVVSLHQKKKKILLFSTFQKVLFFFFVFFFVKLTSYCVSFFLQLLFIIFFSPQLLFPSPLFSLFSVSSSGLNFFFFFSSDGIFSILHKYAVSSERSELRLGRSREYK